jgi:HAD superfamily hydrolase (TIGR01549 family)
MAQGVFFDLYGTLLIYGDMQAGWRSQVTAMQRFVVSKGGAISTDMLSTYYQTVMARPRPPSLDGTSPFEACLDDVCREVSLTLTPYEISELADICVNAWQQYTTLDPQSIPVLKSLRQSFKTALITNFDYPVHIQRVLREMELAPLFETVLISGTLGCSKPDRRIFDTALRKTGLQPGDVIFVGDSIEDIQGALNAGIQPVYLRRPSAPLLDLRNMPTLKVITELADLLPWLGGNHLT